MSLDKATVIEQVCVAVKLGQRESALEVLREYPFTLETNMGRRYSILDATRVFFRDGFIDRYTGSRLVNPAVLRILSTLFPVEFPFHKNWKMDETHPAYWELTPTVDHVLPLARGGGDLADNWVTTSMVRNSLKAHWTIEELGWQLHPCGNMLEWDGLTSWLIRYIEDAPATNHEPYVMKWYAAARKIAA